MPATILVRFAKAMVAGAIGALAVKFTLNHMLVINGVGWLDRMLGNPSWWLWAVTRAFVGGITQAIRQWKRQDQSRLLETWSDQNSYIYRAVVGRDELGDLVPMHAFGAWHQGHYHLISRGGDIDVQMVDLMISKSRGKKTQYREQTVTIVWRHVGNGRIHDQ